MAFKPDNEIDSIPEILSDPNKLIERTRGTSGILSRLFRLMLRDGTVSNEDKGSIKYQAWNKYMDAYLNDPRNGVPNNRHDRVSFRGNLNKEFGRTRMTWKVFCKVLRFLQFENVVFTVQCRRKGTDTYFQHSVEVDLGSPE